MKNFREIAEEILSGKIVTANQKIWRVILDWYHMRLNGIDTKNYAKKYIKLLRKAYLYRVTNKQVYEYQMDIDKMVKVLKAYRPNIIDALTEENILPDNMIIDFEDGKLNDINSLKYAYKYALENRIDGMIPLFTKSGAKRVLFFEDNGFDNTLNSVLSNLEMLQWFNNKERTIKALSKIGIVLFRQGHRVEANGKFRLMVINEPMMDGTICLFKKGIVQKLLKNESLNDAEAFQGTLFQPGLFAKGMFSEVDNIVLEYWINDLSNIDGVINIANCFGDRVLDIEENSIIEINRKWFSVFTTSIDYEPKARLSPQFLTYQLDMEKEISHLSQYIINRIKQRQLDKFVDNGWQGRGIIAGFPEYFYLWDYDLEQNRFKNTARQLFSINLGINKIGATIKLVGVNAFALAGILEYKNLLPNNIDTSQIIFVSPKVWKQLGGTKADRFIEVKGFKNPVMPLRNQVNTYYVFQHKGLKGSCAWIADTSAHLTEVSGDYDGDDIVIYRSDINLPLNDLDFSDYPVLSEIRVDSHDIKIENIDDIITFFAMNQISGVGESEVTMDLVWSMHKNLAFLLRRPDRNLSKHWIQNAINMELEDTKAEVIRWSKNVQGYIDAKKKVVVGLESGFAFMRKIRDAYGLKDWTKDITTMRRIYKKYILNAYDQKTLARFIKQFVKVINKGNLPVGNLLNKPLEILAEMKPYKEKKWKIKGKVYDINSRKRITKIADLQLRWLIATYIDEVLNQEESLTNFYHLFNMDGRIPKLTQEFSENLTTIKMLRKKKLRTTDIDEFEEEIEMSVSLRNRNYLILKEIIDAVHELFNKLNNQTSKTYDMLWFVVGYMCNPIIFFEIAPMSILVELAAYHKKLMDDGTIIVK